MSEGKEFLFERRRYPRFNGALPVEYRRADSPRIHPGHTVNISEGGLMILASERLKVGEQLETKVYFSSASGLVTFKAVVRVVWSDGEGGRTDYYEFGVSYVSVSPEDMKNLKSFMAQHADQDTGGSSSG